MKKFTLKLNLHRQRRIFLKCFYEVEGKYHNNNDGDKQCKTKDGIYYHAKIDLINDVLNNHDNLEVA